MMDNKLNEHIKEKLASLSEVARFLREDYEKAAKSIKEESTKLKYNYRWFLDNVHNCDDLKEGKQLAINNRDKEGRRICGYCGKLIENDKFRLLSTEDIHKIKMDQLKLVMV